MNQGATPPPPAAESASFAECSVLMSLYIKEKPSYLAQCLESLARQSLPAAEIVLVEDGEITTALRAVIDSWTGKLPLRRVLLPTNVGLAAALNAGLAHCSHDLVARMDTDDVALPERLAVQLAFMQAHPEISVLGAWVAEKDATMSRTVLVKKLPLAHAEIVSFTKRRNPISHPVCVFRKQAVLAVGGYPQVFPEDYALWSLMIMRGFQFANLPQVLLDMRTGEDFIDRRGFDFLRREVSLVRYELSIGFFSLTEALLFFAVRAAVRLPPPFVRKMLYRYSR